MIKQVSYLEKIQNSLGKIVKNINAPFMKIFSHLDQSARKSRKSLALMNSQRFQSFTGKKFPSLSFPKRGGWDEPTSPMRRPKAASFLVNIKEASNPVGQTPGENEIKLFVVNNNKDGNNDTSNTNLDEEIPKGNNYHNNHNNELNINDTLEKIQEESNSKDSESVHKERLEGLSIPEIKLGKLNLIAENYRHSLAPSLLQTQKPVKDQKIRSSLRLPNPASYLSVE